jgi:hypothetical protein
MSLSNALSSLSTSSSAGSDVESKISKYFESLAYHQGPPIIPVEPNILQMSQKEHDSFIQELFTTSPLASPLLSSITKPCTSFPTSQDSTELEMIENNENKELHDAQQSIDKCLKIKI